LAFTEWKLLNDGDVECELFAERPRQPATDEWILVCIPAADDGMNGVDLCRSNLH